MKFSTKLTISITLLIIIVFTIGGLVLINFQFNYSINKVSEQYMQAHIDQRQLMQNKIANASLKKPLTEQQLMSIV